MKFLDLRWEKSSPPVLVQGVKNNQAPKNAIGGGNGSFIINNDSSELILIYMDNNGLEHQINIIDDVKKINNWSRLSENRVNYLKEKLNDTENFSIEKLAEILKLQ